jgi:DNA mismatch endonuclease (patch repair protein)
MSRLGRRDTAPEVALRSALHAHGLRFRVDRRVAPEIRAKADIVFPRERIAVFVDGCFWHVCPEHATWPRANGEWWRQKLEGNVARDRLTDARLRDLGWTVIRVWEHEASDAAALRVAAKVRELRNRLEG